MNEKKPTLVILAAGMGSRYGGLKQMDPIDDQGHVIMDYSIYDALEAGFGKVVFIIKEEIDHDFRQLIGKRIETLTDVVYVHQEVDQLPEGYELPEGRIKPWGTAHAILQAKDVVDGPFAVINADDYYGKNGFALLADFLNNEVRDDHACMVGYVLKNTVSDFGHVARGVCEVEGDYLQYIQERKRIVKCEDGIYDQSTNPVEKLPDESVVSMNMWGFSPAIFDKIEAEFPYFYEHLSTADAQNKEFLLPEVVQHQLSDGSMKVRVLTSRDRWYGVTYQQDKEHVVEALAALRGAGQYSNF